MGLFSKNGKLLVDGARLRGCCCEGWRLTAISYEPDHEPRCCAVTITMPDPDYESCIPGNISNAAFNVESRIKLSARNSGCEYPYHCSAQDYDTAVGTGETVVGNVATATAVVDIYDTSAADMITYTFTMTFLRCDA